MRSSALWFVCVGVVASLSAPAALADSAAKKGLEIAVKMDEANSGFDGQHADVELQLYSAAGDKTVRKMVARVTEIANDGDRSLLTINWPPDVRGVKLLTWAHRRGDDDRWLYLPSIKRVKRISSRGKTGSFMGSEFTYEDLTSREVPRFTYKFLGDQKVGKRKVWVIERYPKGESGYSKHVIFIDKQYISPLRIAYYDRKGELLKTSTLEGYKKYENRWWRPDKITMVNRQTGKKSVFIFSNQVLGKSLSGAQFTAESLSGQ